MNILDVFRVALIEHQKLAKSSKYFQLVRLSSSIALSEPEPKTVPERKIIKVAIVGRPNAGKSTLINKILDVNLCGVSCKSHTTRQVLRTSFTENNTQIVFLDTPGLVTQKEISRFKLTNNFRQAFGKKVVNEADVIGIIHELRKLHDIFKFPLVLNRHLEDLPERKPLFLVLNKVDLISDKKALITTMESLKQDAEDLNKPNFYKNFSKIFFTSAIQNVGVREIVDYLLEQAKPGNWMFEADEKFNAPLNTLVLELLRAQFLNYFPKEIPYSCKYEIEYLKQNDLGEIICVSLVTCRYQKHMALITSKKKNMLRLLCNQLESDLFIILGRVFRIRVVVQAAKK